MTNSEETQEAERTPALPCIVCDKPLMNAMHMVKNQPLDGLQFKTNGHYGTTLFDPMSEFESIAVNICDECLKAKSDKVLYRFRKPSRPEYDYSTLTQYLEELL